MSFAHVTTYGEFLQYIGDVAPTERANIAADILIAKTRVTTSVCIASGHQLSQAAGRMADAGAF